ncbi:hypothetical protein [Variovorax sp. IB41]|uniref:hypothetical protein n=1 Tax=Variovorax sp. IB41 TaxID=2779370 RepID=UPI0018E901C6|nr:hypothetical protein [Variovorax sp. IB41]MBJ2159680.1 hypothetical protein [Variovorax sp. IB41]
MNRQLQIDDFSLRAHCLAVERLRADPTRIVDLSATLERWQMQSGETRSDSHWAEWRTMLAAGVDAIEAATCSADDHAVVLRSVSPAGILITQEERDELRLAAGLGAVQPGERRSSSTGRTP